MSINFNKLFIQDIIARRESSHRIDIAEVPKETEEDEGEFGSDEGDSLGLEIGEDLEEPGSDLEQEEIEKSRENSQKRRLVKAFRELRVEIERQTVLHAQLNGTMGLFEDSRMLKSGHAEETEKNSKVPSTQSKLSAAQTNLQNLVSHSTSSSHPSSLNFGSKAGDEINYAHKPHRKKDSSQTSVVQNVPAAASDHDLSSFKRCERLSKKKERVVVEIRVVFLKIGEIDTLKETYRADAFIQVKWREPRLDGKTDEELRRIDLQRCWNPLILIDNILSESKDQHWSLTQKSEQNEVYIVERRRLRGVFLETLELNDFPLDVQDLTITLTSERPDSEVILVPDRNELCGINLQTLIDQQEWKLHEHIEVTRRSATQEYTNSSQHHPCISVTCRAARRPGYFYWNVFLIMDKYVLMSLAILCVVSIWHAVVTLIPTDAEFEQSAFQSAQTLSLLRSPTFSTHNGPLLGKQSGEDDSKQTFQNDSEHNLDETLQMHYLYRVQENQTVTTPSVANLSNRVTTQLAGAFALFAEPKPSIDWETKQWQDLARRHTIQEREKRRLKMMIERDVFTSFCVLYVLAHLTFIFWLYFDASKRRREMVERDKQYKRCLQASKAV
ncbi:hypothetical protein PHET_00094 [Paragonimus heterotremus]|uniref:Neurotransmitter-gated ion-channel ligand-binding domain-containing protein n=1 Tax=Paragonimus heterotremus TaxID=100268 RepID=A0A8J4WVG5_9TREM|nr:hypothetical protein PHET_00094 [Paragonimus heterotremus]